MSSLSGRTIVVTRPRAQADALVRRLARSGARVVCAPVIKIAEPSSYRRMDAALRALPSYRFVVFTSQNAVERFFARGRALGMRPRLGEGARAFAIGEKTAAALADRGWAASAVAESRGEALARAIPARPGDRVLLPRAKRARPELPAGLRRRGARVSIVEAYRTVPDTTSAPLLRRLADSGRVDAVTFTSASTVEHLARQLGRARFRKLFARAVAASIGPITTQALRRLGVRPLQAAGASHEDLAAALRRRLTERRP